MTEPVVDISPAPTEEEAAAIVAAVEMSWPRAVTGSAEAVPRWRFSGRWWTKPVPAGRARP